jgi:biotin transport system ATP-binding protein
MTPEHEKPPLFSIRRLTKSFPNGARPLDGLNLDIYEGETLVIAGPNGSGKTALMCILAGLAEPDSGEIRYQGGADGSPGCAGDIGLVFQDADAQLLGETVAEDAAFGPLNQGLSKTEAGVRATRALEAVGLAGKEDWSPHRLSGGEKRRLAVAGVLAMGRNTLILDEPFANLDWPGVRQTLGIIRDLKRHGATLIILTHELEKVLAFADRLVILHGGMAVADGPPAEILDRLRPEYGVRDPRHCYTRVEDCTWLDE